MEDKIRSTKQLQGSSVEIETDNSPERNQEVAVTSLPHLMETPEQFQERIDKEEENAE